MAAAMTKVPASMRSAMISCVGAVQFRDALDEDGAGARAFDPRAHLDEHFGEIDDLGFAGGVFDDGFPVGENRSHQDVFGAGDGDAVEDDRARP